MDTAAIQDLLKRAVVERQIKISIRAAEGALAEEINRREIEAALLSAGLLEDYPDWWLGPYGRRATSAEMDLAHQTRR